MTNPQPPAAEREILEHYRPWLRKVAAGMTTPARAEELAQEGWIALWRAHRDYDGSAPLDWWLKRKAHGRMLMLVGRDWQTVKATQDIAAGHPTAEEPAVWGRLAVDLGSIEFAYHAGEILDAINRLTPREREYVFLRFWCGWRQPQMVAHFGYEPNGLWRTSRMKLRGGLAHLAALHEAA